jgi:serine/threonine protein kinase
MEDMSDSINIGSSFFAGSTRWMAPELILALVEDDGGVPPITTYSDVYAFASVCLEVGATHNISLDIDTNHRCDTQIATGHIPYPHRSNDHAVTVDIMRGIKPLRGAICHIPLKDEEAFWTMLDRCWDQAFCLRPPMSEVLRLLTDM